MSLESYVFRGLDGSFITVSFIDPSGDKSAYWFVTWRMPSLATTHDQPTHVERIR